MLNDTLQIYRDVGGGSLHRWAPWGRVCVEWGPHKAGKGGDVQDTCQTQ